MADNKLTLDRAVIIPCLMVGHAIDIASSLIFEIHEREFQDNTILPFPCLIIDLVREDTLSVLDIDQLVEVIKTINASIIWDDTNLTTPFRFLFHLQARYSQSSSPRRALFKPHHRFFSNLSSSFFL